MKGYAPLISIITVNYNQTVSTVALLQSIQQQAYQHLEIIVVDNASKENPEIEITNQFPEVIFIRSEVNTGFAGGNNLGLQSASGEYIFFINNDTELTYYCIDRLLAFIQQHEDCGAVSPLICYHTAETAESDTIQYAGMTRVSPFTGRNSIIGEKLKDAGQFLSAVPTAYAHGAAMMVPRTVIDKVGMMPEVYFLYYEELDWCEQIRRAGYSVWVEPSARIYHKESLSVNSLGALKTYFLYRNRMLFIQRNHPVLCYIFYVYYWFVVVTKNSLLFLLRGEKASLKAMWQATLWFFFARSNSFETLLKYSLIRPKVAHGGA